MSEQHEEYQEYLRKIESEKKRKEFAFLMQVMPQGYGSSLDALCVNFKPLYSMSGNSTFALKGHVILYYKAKPLFKKVEKNSFINNGLKGSYLQQARNVSGELDEKSPGALTDFNRENHLGRKFETQNKGSGFNQDSAELFERWLNYKPHFSKNVFVMYPAFGILSDKGFQIQTKEGEIKEFQINGEEYKQIETTLNAFCYSVLNDEWLFEVEGYKKKKTLSDLLEFSMPIDEIFLLIKKEMDKDPILGKYVPTFFPMARIETNPSEKEPIYVSEFCYERSSLLAFKDEFIEKALEGLQAFSPEFEVAYTAFKQNPNYYTRTAVQDILQTICNEEDQALFWDYIICADKKRELQERIKYWANILETMSQENFQVPFYQILRAMPEEYKEYKKFLDIRSINFQWGYQRFEKSFKAYLKCKYALEILASPDEELLSKKRAAAKILNGLNKKANLQEDTIFWKNELEKLSQESLNMSFGEILNDLEILPQESLEAPLDEILKNNPKEYPSYQQLLDVRNIDFKAESQKFEKYYENYLRSKYALEILTSSEEGPLVKMRKAAKILNESIEYGREFLEKFNDSVKIHTKELEGEKKAEEKAKAIVCANMQEEAEEIRFILLEEILETLEGMCLYDSNSEEWQIHVTVEKYQIFINKLNIYGEIAKEFAKSDGPDGRGDQISSDINENMHCVPKFLGIERSSNPPLESLIGVIQEKFNSLLEVERTWKIKRDLLFQAEEFHEQLYKPVAHYIEGLRENLAPDILNKFEELQRANQELINFLQNRGEEHDRIKQLLNGLNGRVTGKSLDLLGSKTCSEVLIDDFQELEGKYNQALIRFNELWINDEEGLGSIVKNRGLEIKNTFVDAMNSAMFSFEQRQIYGPGFDSKGLEIFFKAIIKSVRETESKNTLNDVKKTCQTYLKAISKINKENRFFSEKEVNGGLVSSWINMLDYPGYHRIEFCSPGKREVPKQLEEGVLYLEKMDGLDDEDDESLIKLHTLYHWDNEREVETKKLIHVFNGKYPNDIAWDVGEITRAQDEAFFQSIAGVCHCKYTPDEKLKKIRKAVKENFEIKTTLWTELIEKLLELLKNIGFNVPEKTPEEKFKKEMALTLTDWKKEQERKEEGVHNIINLR